MQHKKKKKALNLNAIWKWQQLCISMKTARIAQITTAQFKWWWPNKVSPPQLNWNSGFYSSQYMLKTSKRVLQADIPPPLPPSYLHESNSKRAQAGIYVGNRNTELSSPSSSAWWFQKEDKKVRQTLQRNSSWAKAYPRPHHSKDGFAWETIIVLINRNKSLKRERKKKAASSQFLYLQA